MKTKNIALLIILICAGFFGYFFLNNFLAPEIEKEIETPTGKETEKQKETKSSALKMPKTENSHFGFMHPDQSYPEAKELNVHWERPHPGPFIWGKIEKEKGNFDFFEADECVKISQSYEFNILATIWPFADWDQKTCHTKLDEKKAENFFELGEYRAKPCDMNAYRKFVKAIVERYDDDGKDDMPGLLFPIKYWEVSNEPSMQDDLVFFKGTPDSYFKILKATYEAAKEADSEAKILHGGAAGMSDDDKIFWQRVFDLGGADYFDIANHHSIGSGGESLHIPGFKEFLKENNIKKPLWMPEIQFSAWGLEKEKLSQEEWADFLVRTFVYAFGEGEEKLFYVGLDPSPGDSESWLLYAEEKKAGFKKEMGEKTKQAPYYAFETMVSKIDYFTLVEKLNEGQYKFTVNEKSVYVLWGDGNIPEEIKGTVKITDIKGNGKEADASSIVLTESPIFIEIK